MNTRPGLPELARPAPNPFRAAAGIVGPTAFVTAWAALGGSASGYSPVHDPISRLAALGAPTRPLMTAGMLAFAAGVAIYAPALRAALPGHAATAAAVTAAGALGVALTPLESAAGGTGHAAAVAVSYASLAAVPALSARPLAARGARLAAIASGGAAAAAAAFLVASVVAGGRTGLWQRTGLTIGHAWIAASALLVAIRRSS